MSVEVFETTLQKTYEWLRDFMQIMNWEDHQKAYLAFKGTLQALRDRLPPDIAVKVGAQFPMLVRGFYYEGWKPGSTPIKAKTPEEFLDFVATHFNNLALLREENIEDIVRAVFQVIARHVSAGEIQHIKQAIPLPITLLWPSAEESEQYEMDRREAKQSSRQRQT